MKPNSILFYSLKENSIKNNVIDLLSVKWPLTLTEMHKAICQDQNLKVSYQAIRKAVKQLQEDGCLVQIDKTKFQINIEWLKSLGDKIRSIETNYQGKFSFPKTVFAKKGKGINVLVAKDGIVRDKLREEKLNHLLKKLISIYRKEFGPHNIFRKNQSEVLDYLLRVQKQNEILIFLIDDKVVGGTVFEKKDESLEGDHMVWKLKHFALIRGLSLKIEKAIMKEIEDRLRKKSKSMKIQLNLSENEQIQIKMFESFGFIREGVLENHYRVGENMYIYSKLYSK